MRPRKQLEILHLLGRSLNSLHRHPRGNSPIRNARSIEQVSLQLLPTPIRVRVGHGARELVKRKQRRVRLGRRLQQPRVPECPQHAYQVRLYGLRGGHEQRLEVGMRRRELVRLEGRGERGAGRLWEPALVVRMRDPVRRRH